MGEPLIRIDHVEKIYRRDQIEVPVLLGVNLEIPEGEYVEIGRASCRERVCLAV